MIKWINEVHNPHIKHLKKSRLFNLLANEKDTPESHNGGEATIYRQKLTRNEAKCSDVMTALKPTTGTRAANNVPRTTYIQNK